MTETTFLDAFEYCDVHGHDAEFIDMTILDMIGNMVQLEICRKCKRRRETLVDDSRGLRMSEQHYPDGEWH